MASYFAMDRGALAAEQKKLQAQYESYKAMGLKLDMSRGKPCTEQLDLSKEMLDMHDYTGEGGFDARNYGALEGMPEGRRFFADLMDARPEQVIVGGNSSLQLMYYVIELAWRNGLVDSPRAWRFDTAIKFLCPVPGYDRHFSITEYLGFQMIDIPMNEDGPDMDLVEELVRKDPAIKGIWCVPVYSNPDGIIYSEKVIDRLARMETAAPDFKIMWDNAYVVHHLTDEVIETSPMLRKCEQAGHPERCISFCSTSKITYPGAGVSAIISSEKETQYIVRNMAHMIISFDKMNQLRHVQYLKNKAGVLEHMKKHRAILAPKFDMVKRIFAEDFEPCGRIASWTDPKGGYFISLYLQSGCAKRTVQLCKDAGVVLTGAGAAFPYGIDPKDSHLRIAPTYPSVQELETASRLLTICARLATVEMLLRRAN